MPLPFTLSLYIPFTSLSIYIPFTSLSLYIPFTSLSLLYLPPYLYLSFNLSLSPSLSLLSIILFLIDFFVLVSQNPKCMKPFLWQIYGRFCVTKILYNIVIIYLLFSSISLSIVIALPTDPPLTLAIIFRKQKLVGRSDYMGSNAGKSDDQCTKPIQKIYHKAQ